MSTEIDDRIVRMQLDNENFERNASQSLSTLEKLHNALSFKNSYEGLTTLNRVISSITFDPFEKGIDKVIVGFDKLGIVGASVINNLTNKIVDFVTSTVKNLTIGQVTAAWGKYEEKIQSVQTIMASTGKEIEEVNKELEQLMWFTDETSYSFIDMTNNISKFTGAGVDLHDASVAMQGISTWAAITGNNTQGAARAMYNLSQAMSAGALLRQDFRSLEMLNMTTIEFKKTALETAAALGTLNKSADGVYTTLKKGTVVTAEGMSETLSERWFTADVLNKTLEKYGGFASKLYEYTEKYDRSATDFMLAIKSYKNGTKDISKIAKDLGVDVKTATSLMNELTSSTYDLGYRAFKASQEAKTFTDVIGALRDAVSTKWMDIYEQIFGNYEEAAETWTTVANKLYEVFTMGLDERKDLLKAWKEVGGRDTLFDAIDKIYDHMVNIASTINSGFRELFPKATVADALIFSQAIKMIGDKLKPTKKELARFENIGRGIGAVLNIITNSINALFLGLKPVITSLGTFISTTGGKLLKFLSKTGKNISNIANELINSGFYDNIEKIIMAFNELVGLAIWEEIKELSPAINELKNSFQYFKDTIKDIFKPLTDSLQPFIKSLSGLFRKDFNDSTDIAAKGLNKIYPIIEIIFKILNTGIKTLTKIINGVTVLINKLKELDILKRIKDILSTLGTLIFVQIHYELKGLTEVINNIKTNLRTLFEMFWNGKIGKSIQSLLVYLVLLKESLKNIFNSGGNKDANFVLMIFENISKVISGLFIIIDKVLVKFNSLLTFIINFINAIPLVKQMLDYWTRYSRISEKFSSAIENIKTGMKMLKEELKSMLESLKNLVTLIFYPIILTFTVIKELIKQIIKPFFSFEKTVNTVGDGLNTFSKATDGAQKNISKLTGPMGIAQAIFVKIITVIKTVLALLESFGRIINEVLRPIIKFITEITNTISESIKAFLVLEFIPSFSEKIKSALSTIFQTMWLLSEKISDITGKINKAKSAVNNVKLYIDAIIGFFRKLIDYLPIVKDFFLLGMAFSGRLFTNLKSLFDLVLGSVKKILNVALAPLLKVILSIKAIKLGGKLFDVSNAEKFTKFLNRILPIVKFIFSVVAFRLGQHVDQIVYALTVIYSVLVIIVDTIVKIVKLSVTIVKKAIESIKKALEKISIDFFGMGENGAEGFALGFFNKKDEVFKKIREFFDGIIEYAKEILGIHSPSTVFAKIAEYVVEGFKIGLEGFKGLLNIIKDIIQSLIKTALTIALNTLGYFSVIIPKAISYINTILAGIFNGLDVTPIINFIFKISKVLLSSLFALADDILQSITKSLPKITYILNSLIDIVVKALLGLNLSKLTKTLTGLLGSVNDAVQKAFSLGEEKKGSSIIDNLKTFAIAIAILSTSMFLLSKIDAKGGARAVSLIIVTMAGVIGAIRMLNGLGRTKISSNALVPSNGKASKFLPSLNGTLDNPFVQMLFIATSIAMVAGALSRLAKRDPSKQIAAAAAIMVVMSALINSVKRLQTINEAKIIGIAKTLKAIRSLISTVATVVVVLSLMKPEKLAKGLGGVLGIFAVITGLVAALIGLSKWANKGTSTLTKNLTNPLNELIKVLKTIAAVTVVMALVVQMLGNSKSLLKGVVGLLGIFAAITALIAGLIGLSKWANKGVGLTSLNSLIPPLLAIAAVSTILAMVVKMFAKMDFGALMQGLIGLAGVFTMLSVVMLIMTKISENTSSGDMTETIAAMLAMSVAVIAIANSVKTLGETENKMAAIITLAAALGLLVGAAYLVEKLKLGPALIKIAAACAGVGIAAAGIGIGIKAAVEGIVLFASSIDILIAAIPKLVEFVTTLLLSMLTQITMMIPSFVEAGWNLIITFITSMATSLINNTSELLTAVGTLLNSIGTFLQQCWPLLLGWGWNLLLRIRDGIVNHVSDIAQAARDLIDGFVNGITERVSQTWKDITGWASNVIDFIRKQFDEHSPSKVMEQIGIYVVMGFTNGIKKQTKSISKQLNETFVNPMETAMKKVNDLVKNTAKTMSAGGDTLKSSFKNLGGLLEQFAKKSNSNLSGDLYKNLYKQTDAYKKYKKATTDANNELDKLKVKSNSNTVKLNKLDEKTKKKTTKQLDSEISDKEKELVRLKSKKTETTSKQVNGEYTKTEKVSAQNVAALKQEQGRKGLLGTLASTVTKYFGSSTTSEQNKTKDDINKLVKTENGKEVTYDLEKGTKSYKTEGTKTVTTTKTSTVGSASEISKLEKEIADLKSAKKLKEDQAAINKSIGEINKKISNLKKESDEAYNKFINEQKKKYSKDAIEAIALLDKAITANAEKRYKETDAYKTYKANLKEQNKNIDDYNKQIDKINNKAKKKDKDFKNKTKKDYEKELKSQEKLLKKKEEAISKSDKKKDKAKIKKLKEEKQAIEKQIETTKAMIEYKTNIGDIKDKIKEAQAEIKNLNKQSKEDMASVWDEYVASVSEAMKESTKLVGRTFEGISDLTAKFEKGEKISISKILKNYQSQNDAKAEYQLMLGNIQTKLDPEFYEYIKGLGLDGYRIVEAIYNASDEEIAALGEEYQRGLSIDYTKLKKDTVDEQTRTVEFANMITALYGYGKLVNNDLIEELSKEGVEAYDLVRMILKDAMLGNKSAIKEINTLYENSQNLPDNAANTIAAIQAVVKETGLSDYLQNEGVVIANAIDTSKLASTTTAINKKFSSYAASNTAKRQTNSVNNNNSTITNTNNTSNNYTQNIYSPRALNNSEIYRQTHRLVSVNN